MHRRLLELLERLPTFPSLRLPTARQAPPSLGSGVSRKLHCTMSVLGLTAHVGVLMLSSRKERCYPFLNALQSPLSDRGRWPGVILVRMQKWTGFVAAPESSRSATPSLRGYSAPHFNCHCQCFSCQCILVVNPRDLYMLLATLTVLVYQTSTIVQHIELGESCGWSQQVHASLCFKSLEATSSP